MAPNHDKKRTKAPQPFPMKDDYDENKNLSDPIATPDGKQVITLEDFLGRSLKHPEREDEALRLNATNLLRLLGVKVIGMTDAKRANKWLRAHGYRAVHNGQVYRVALVDTPAMPFHVV